jgi:hypothetical protein
MLTTVSGIYENGQITLDEDLPATTKRAKILVTVLESSETVELEKPKRQLGRLKGTFIGDYWFSEAFNEPLEDLKDYM